MSKLTVTVTQIPEPMSIEAFEALSALYVRLALKRREQLAAVATQPLPKVG